MKKTRFTAAERKARSNILASARIANRKIRELREAGYDSESVKLLQARLEKAGLITKKGTIRVRIPSFIKKEIQFREIQQSFKFFERSESSTVSGMKNIIQRQRDYIAGKTSRRFANMLSDSQLISFNRVYESREWENLRDVVASDETSDIMMEAKQKRWSENKFEKELTKYMEEEPDVNLKNDIKTIYELYVKR